MTLYRLNSSESDGDSHEDSVTRSHYPERASALDFKDAAVPRIGHSDAVFDLFRETFVFNRILSNFSKLF